MVETNKTEQEMFWSGDFGDEYTKRNAGAELLASNLSLLARALSRIQKIDSVVEFGANIGLNLQVQHSLQLGSKVSGALERKKEM